MGLARRHMLATATAITSLATILGGIGIYTGLTVRSASSTSAAWAAQTPTSAMREASSAKFPIYSSAFTGNTPFHDTVAQLIAAGATVLPATIARNYWAQGIANLPPASQSGGAGPLYTVHPGDPGYTFRCTTWGACNAHGLVVHLPKGASAQSGSDHHLSVFDPVYLHGEVDGWGGDGSPERTCNIVSGDRGAVACSWGGWFPFGGSGLSSQPGHSGNAGGYAFGLMDITAQELLQGHIDHALGIEQSCLDDGGVYPSQVGRRTDSPCPSNIEPNAVYGDLVHLKSSVDVRSLGYSQYCEVIVQALQKYGAYTADNNGHYGIYLNLEYMSDYSGTNPWFTTIFPSLAAGGDGDGSGPDFSFKIMSATDPCRRY